MTNEARSIVGSRITELARSKIAAAKENDSISNRTTLVSSIDSKAVDLSITDTFKSRPMSRSVSSEIRTSTTGVEPSSSVSQFSTMDSASSPQQPFIRTREPLPTSDVPLNFSAGNIEMLNKTSPMKRKFSVVPAPVSGPAQRDDQMKKKQWPLSKSKSQRISVLSKEDSLGGPSKESKMNKTNRKKIEIASNNEEATYKETRRAPRMSFAHSSSRPTSSSNPASRRESSLLIPSRSKPNWRYLDRDELIRACKANGYNQQIVMPALSSISLLPSKKRKKRRMK